MWLKVGPFLALLALAATPLATPGAALVDASRAPVAEFNATASGAYVNWTVTALPLPPATDGDVAGYEVWRIQVGAQDDRAVHDAEVLDVVPHDAGTTTYSYLDATHDSKLLSIYIVQPVYDDGTLAPPSNPVGNYPRCGWGTLDTDPPQLGFHTYCLFPPPITGYPRCAAVELYVIPFHYDVHPDCVVPAI
jgi:hypothetical protein